MAVQQFDYRNYQLTPEERRQIVSKEVLTIEHIGKLFSFRYTDAAALIRQIRFKSDRLHRSGMVHVMDYCDYFGLSLADFRGLAQ